MNIKTCRIHALALLTLLASACQSPQPDQLESIYYDALADYTRDDGTGALDKSVLERQDRRLATVRAFVARGQLQTADQYLFAAAILVTSDSIEDLVKAHELALHSAELGDERALSVAAEATDKVALKHSVPQRYGTQYVYDPVTSRWQLYPLDPNTTDTEREAMGVPPLAELLARVDELNAGPLAQRMQGESE